MRALARERRVARLNREVVDRLGLLSADATARVQQLERGTAAVVREREAIEEIAVGHEAAAQALARWLLDVAGRNGDPILTDPGVTSVIRHYMPELGGPARDHATGTG